jgi:hypothetical protein
MKKGIIRFSILLLSSILIFTACNRKNDVTPDDSSAQIQNGNDDHNASIESDAALNDANKAISDQIAMNGARIAAGPIPIVLTGAGATYIYDSTATDRRITITYDGTTIINGRTRTGKVVGTIPKKTGNVSVHWTTPGAVLTLKCTNLKATRVSDGKSLTLNGAKTVTNVSGGDIKTLAATGTGSIVHKIKGTDTLTFDNGGKRTWNVARTRTITKITNGYSISISGDTTIDGHSRVAMWGTNRAGIAFYSTISTPVVWNDTSCSPFFVPVSGVRIIQGLEHALSITFGVDNSGTVVTTGCPYGFKLNWVNVKGELKEVVRPYL